MAGFLGLMIAALAVFAPDDDIVREFKKYFREYKDTPTRVEAILSLEGTETEGVVTVLVPMFKIGEPEIDRATIRVLGGFETQPPVDALLASLDKQSNQAIRLGLLRSLAEGKYGGTAEMLLPMLEHKSWEVRWRALEALAAQQDPQWAEHIAVLCEDPEVAVRCAAMDSLADVGSELVIDPAIASLNDDAWQVRASAIHALKSVRRQKSIEPLLERMQVEEGRLLADIGSALEELTARGFGQRTEQWLNFWNTFKDRFQMPTDEQIATLRQKQKESREKYNPVAGNTVYHGIETPSRRVLFIIDVSGSMENLVVEKERFKDGDYPSYLRIDIVKTELARTIERLEPYVEFNIISFATDVKVWNKALVKANVVKKSSASDWVGRLEAIGGASNEDLALAGLTGAANLEAGKTNTYGALATALGVPLKGEKPRDYEDVEVDTIFFLSDGRPSEGDYVDPDDILREINAANELRKVVIHTIAIGEFQKSFMRRLAEENGGVFVDLGR